MKNAPSTGHLASCLQRLGAKRVEAKLLSCLLDASPLPTKEVVRRTRLRQPEVSVGMRGLRERGWVVSEPIPREGKGRPMHRYRLAVDPNDVYAHYAAAAQQIMDNMRAALSDLAERLPVDADLVDAAVASHERGVAHA